MKIKKGFKFVCTEDVYMEYTNTHEYIKGNIYLSEEEGCLTDESEDKHHSWSESEIKNYFKPYSELDKVYTKHTPLLEKIFDKYDGKKSTGIGEEDIKFFDNVAGGYTSWFVSTSGLGEGYYKDEGYTYLSEQAFIEYMDLGKYIGSLNVESEETSYSFPTDWYLNLDNPEVDINIIKDYLRGIRAVDSNFITDAHGYLLGQDIMGDGSYQYWGSSPDLLVNKYNLVKISYQDFLNNVYPKKESEEGPNYLKIAEESPKEGEKAESKEDMVNNPSHYTKGGIECIDAIKASMSSEAFKGFLKGQVLKYSWRYESKFNPLEDLKKMMFYGDRLIKELEDEG